MVSSFCLDPTILVAIRSNKITNTVDEGDVVWITRLICNPEQSLSRLVEGTATPSAPTKAQICDV